MIFHFGLALSAETVPRYVGKLHNGLGLKAHLWVFIMDRDATTCHVWCRSWRGQMGDFDTSITEGISSWIWKDLTSHLPRYPLLLVIPDWRKLASKTTSFTFTKAPFTADPWPNACLLLAIYGTQRRLDSSIRNILYRSFSIPEQTTWIMIPRVDLLLSIHGQRPVFHSCCCVLALAHITQLSISKDEHQGKSNLVLHQLYPLESLFPSIVCSPRHH